MAFNFPPSPTNFQIYVAPSGLTYRYNSSSGVWESYDNTSGYQGSYGFQGSAGFQGSFGFQGSLGFTGYLGSSGTTDFGPLYAFNSRMF